jgi:hypothetical protein
VHRTASATERGLGVGFQVVEKLLLLLVGHLLPRIRGGCLLAVTVIARRRGVCQKHRIRRFWKMRFVF